MRGRSLVVTPMNITSRLDTCCRWLFSGSPNFERIQLGLVREQPPFIQTRSIYRLIDWATKRRKQKREHDSVHISLTKRATDWLTVSVLAGARVSAVVWVSEWVFRIRNTCSLTNSRGATDTLTNQAINRLSNGLAIHACRRSLIPRVNRLTLRPQVAAQASLISYIKALTLKVDEQ